MNIVISINDVFGWRVCVLGNGGEGGGSGFFLLCYKHGQQSTVWQMKDIHSRQLFLMRMESDGNCGGSAVWGDRKCEDHSIATVPV